MQIKILMEDPDYLEQTSELLFREWSSLPSWANKEDIRARLIERNSDSRQMTLVVVDTENNVIAAGSHILYELNDDPTRIHWLGEIITRPSYRGQGIGSVLMNGLIERASVQKIAELWLYTPDMQPFYRKFGWEDREIRNVAGEVVTLMALNLQN